MKIRTRRGAIVLSLSMLATGWAAAEDIPLKNWAAPVRWSPTGGHGLTTLSETNPLPFIALSPCRILDTRGNGAPYTGGAFTGGSDVRDYILPGVCGIPASVAAVSLNFTIVGPTQPGFLVAWATGGVPPPTSILNFSAGQLVNNAALVPTSSSGSIRVNVSAPTDLIMDVNGYFPNTTVPKPLNPTESFAIAGSFGGGVISGTNSSTAASSAGVSGIEIATTGTVFGVSGQSASATSGSAGVQGLATSTTGTTYGVLGQTSSTSSSSAGVRGTTLGATGQTYGVLGENGSTTTGAAGVRGRASASTGVTYGILGENSSTANESVGVKGFDSGGALPTVVPNVSAGVRGDSALGVGVFGFSRSTGVAGTLLNSAGNVLAAGYLGYATGTYGVYANGDIGATGMKFFVEPHPTDAAKVIRYVALEGPEAGTYFRGSARTVHGSAVIEVPDTFRIVTAEEGLTVQLTPVGDLATIAVVAKGLRTIEVRSSRDTDFDYEVKGIRRAFRSFQPIADSGEFIPGAPDAKLPSYLSEEARRRLVENGTYNPDGSVNLSTAQRLGWLKAWEERAEALSRASAGK